MPNSIFKKQFDGNIYREIYHNVGITRSQLSNRLGLSLPTITHNLQLMTDEGFIMIDGTQDSTGGRKANTYKCVGSLAYSIGIDISPRHINLVIIDLLENIIAQRRIRVTFSDTDKYFADLAAELDCLIKDSGINPDKILGTGISLPAIIEKDQQTVSYCKVIEISDTMYTRIGKFISYRYSLYNDADSAGLAEWWHTRSTRTAIYLSLNTSIGGATINGNNLYTGDNNKASEFGHITLFPNGKRCYCGRKGCLDAYCSEVNLTNFTCGDLESFFEQAKTNEGFRNVLDSYLDHLSLAINTLRMCYDCDIILGGNVGAFLENYLTDIRQKVANLNPFDARTDYLRICGYKKASSAVGAALHYVDEYINSL